MSISSKMQPTKFADAAIEALIKRRPKQDFPLSVMIRGSASISDFRCQMRLFNVVLN